MPRPSARSTPPRARGALGLRSRRPGRRRTRCTTLAMGAAAASAVALATAGCGSSTSTGSGATSSGASSSGGGSRVVDVVAAENFWGNITSQIGGAHAHVTSIISDPNTDPHEYETDAGDAAAIASARVVVLNGVGYDDFASKLLAASPSKHRTVTTIATVAHVSGANPNPHLWYDPTYVHDAADAITADLSKADPSDAATFTANEKTFLTAYQPYVDELATIKSHDAGTKIAYTERVPGYLVQTAGLVLGTPASFSQAVEDGNDPTPADTAAFDAAITSRAVKVLLYNGQVTDAQTDKIKALARSSGVPIVGVTETLPRQDATFQAWQLRQAREIAAALGS